MNDSVNKKESLKVENLLPVIVEFAKTLPPVDSKSNHLDNNLVAVTKKVGSFRAIDKDNHTHEVEYVGNWGRLYLGHSSGMYKKVDLDKIDIVYAY